MVDIEGMPEKYWAGKYKYILGRNKSLGSEWEISSTMLPRLKIHKQQLSKTDPKQKHANKITRIQIWMKEWF